MSMSTAEAAALLGVPAAEVADVGSDDAGPTITDRSGVVYVLRTEPDGAGRTGLLVLDGPAGLVGTMARYTPGGAAARKKTGAATANTAAKMTPATDQTRPADDTGATDEQTTAPAPAKRPPAKRGGKKRASRRSDDS